MRARGRTVTDPAQRGLFDDPVEVQPTLTRGRPSLSPDEAIGSAMPGAAPVTPAPTGGCEKPAPGAFASGDAASTDRGLPGTPAHFAADIVAIPAADSDSAGPGFAHPRANREIRLGGHRVGYALRRGRRRTIGFVVGAEGLSVSAPQWVRVGEVEAALVEKSAWILRKLAEQSERSQRLQAARVDWRDGTTIPFLGEPVIIVVDPHTAGAVLDAGGQSLPGVARLVLRVGLPNDAQAGQIRDAVQSWLQRQARRVFEERCAHFSARLSVSVRRITLSSAQTRWGSARADGSVWLNWRLVHFAMPTIDYVVAHELAHLRHMDHSPQFWDVVRSVIPDVDAERHRLRDDVLPVLD